MVDPSQKKLILGPRKKGKWIFRPKKMKTTIGNIVWNSKMHPCTQYEIIWTNYAMNVAIILIVWVEKPCIFIFDGSFLRTNSLNNCRITSLLFYLVTWSHLMRQCEVFPIFWFILNFLCPFQNVVKTAGMTVPS